MIELPEIPPPDPKTMSKKQQVLYHLAVKAGVTNPILIYFDRCWDISGDNLDTTCIGFSFDEARDNLVRMVDVGQSPLAMF